MRDNLRLPVFSLIACWCLGMQSLRPEAVSPPAVKPTDAQDTIREDGYRGIWFELGQRSEYGDKYSGGLGTYTANHVPMAIYSREADKTFFVYGGAREGRRYLLDMVSYYDHARGVVPRPVVVHDKGGVDDPHDNPSLCLDPQGHLWVFVSGRGKKRPGFIYRSRKPYRIDGFERVEEREFTYPQPRWIPGRGFLHLFTQYTAGRELYWSASSDGRQWTPNQKFAGMEGHYQTSHQRGNRVFTAFNRHPGGNVDRRTDLYFLQTDDLGRTWRNAAGRPVAVPLIDPANSALVQNYAVKSDWSISTIWTWTGRGTRCSSILPRPISNPGPVGIRAGGRSPAGRDDDGR